MPYPPAQGLYDPANEHDACGVGFVCNIKNQRATRIVGQGLEILERLTHRGAVGADPRAGDGAGILVQIPDAFFRAVVGFELPPGGQLRRSAWSSCPRIAAAAGRCRRSIERQLAEGGQRVLGWRDVPVDNSVLGESVLPTEPVVRQVFIARGDNCPDQDAFERKLFVIRKRMDNEIRAAGLRQDRLLRRLPVLADHQLQGHAAGRPGGDLLPGSAATSASPRPWPWCTSASRPTPSRPGIWPTPSA